MKEKTWIKIGHIWLVYIYMIGMIAAPLYLVLFFIFPENLAGGIALISTGMGTFLYQWRYKETLKTKLFRDGFIS